MAIEADNPSPIWEDSGELFSSGLAGWFYWKTLGDEDKVCKVKKVSRSREVAHVEDTGFVRIVPISKWEPWFWHQMAPKAKGSIEFDAGSDDGEVCDPKGVRYVTIFGHRYLAWKKRRIRFEIVGHSVSEVRALPIARRVRLEWCANRDFETNVRVLLRATEYACVLMVR
jgi:hypothetical protein